MSAFPQRAGLGNPREPVVNQRPAPAASAVDVGQLQLTGDRVAAFVEAYTRHLDYLPGEVLVTFKPGMSTSQQQRALMALRSRPSVDDLHWLPGTTTALLRDVTQPDANVLASQLSEQPEVASAQPNYLRHRAVQRQRRIASTTATAAPLGTPNDPDYGNYQWNFGMLDMPHAWDIQPGGNSGLIVATVDTGVTTVTQSFTFPLFTGSAIETVSLPFAVSPDLPQSRIVGPKDFVFMPSGGPVLDFDGHGTHVSSTIGEATNNGILLAGMAYNVRIMPVKVCLGYWELMIANAQAGITGFLPQDVGGCPDDAISSGIRYATDNGAKVINISLGGDSPDTIVRDAIAYAVAHGAFVAIAMGNDFEDGNPIDYPAFYAPQINGAMSVAAVSKFANHAYYSTTGSYCEIAAPGGDDRDASGLDAGYVWQVTLYYPDQDPALKVPRFDRLYGIGYIGTSMATPHVAATAALLMSQGVTDPAAIEALITKTAKDLGAKGKDDTFGNGLIQPRPALFGFGVIK
ncbi:MAG TPA: S8 family serine peptidase [Vicinamibacterales bacterium]|nr:S8 family serine peptidase [Vicinamibacterales bacterium]